MTPCPIPPLKDNTFGYMVEYNVELVTAIKQCNARLATIRTQEVARCAD